VGPIAQSRLVIADARLVISAFAIARPGEPVDSIQLDARLPHPRSESQSASAGVHARHLEGTDTASTHTLPDSSQSQLQQANLLLELSQREQLVWLSRV
jgi:hypothetical protein